MGGARSEKQHLPTGVGHDAGTLLQRRITSRIRVLNVEKAFLGHYSCPWAGKGLQPSPLPSYIAAIRLARVAIPSMDTSGASAHRQSTVLRMVAARDLESSRSNNNNSNPAAAIKSLIPPRFAPTAGTRLSHASSRVSGPVSRQRLGITTKSSVSSQSVRSEFVFTPA